MKKNVIYYSLFIDKNNSTYDNLNYYSMLYYSLLTLENYINDNFDVVVYYISHENMNELHCINEQVVELKKMDLFSINQGIQEQYNIVNRFPKVKFIKSDYLEKSVKLDQSTHRLPYRAFPRWYDLKNVCDMGYENIFYIDCDVFYRSSPEYFFEKYQPKHNEIFCLREGWDPEKPGVLGKAGLCGGQLILNASTIKEKPFLYERCIESYFILQRKAKEYYKEDVHAYNSFVNLSEQYSGQIAMESYGGIVWKDLQCDDICFGQVYDERIQNGRIIIENIRPNVMHYLGPYAYKFLPYELLTPSMVNQYRNYVKQNTK